MDARAVIASLRNLPSPPINIWPFAPPGAPPDPEQQDAQRIAGQLGVSIRAPLAAVCAAGLFRFASVMYCPSRWCRLRRGLEMTQDKFGAMAIRIVCKHLLAQLSFPVAQTQLISIRSGGGTPSVTEFQPVGRDFARCFGLSDQLRNHPRIRPERECLGLAARGLSAILGEKELMSAYLLLAKVAHSPAGQVPNGG